MKKLGVLLLLVIAFLGGLAAGAYLCGPSVPESAVLLLLRAVSADGLTLSDRARLNLPADGELCWTAAPGGDARFTFPEGSRPTVTVRLPLLGNRHKDVEGITVGRTKVKVDVEDMPPFLIPVR